MASMNRNVNLEEIDTDAFMGISYLKYQKPWQKVVFVGGIVTGIALLLVRSFVFDGGSSPFSFLIMLAPLLVGCLFGCNYNEDLPLYKYIGLLISNPSKAYFSTPMTDLHMLRKNADAIRKKETEDSATATMTDEEQRSFLKKLLIGGVAIIVVFIVVIVFLNSMKTEEVHHVITTGSMQIYSAFLSV